MININLYIGLVVEIKTTYGEKVTGEIFCYDEQRKTVVLKLPVKSSQNSSIMLLKTDYIQNIKIVGKNEISGLLLPHISSQNTNQLAMSNEKKMMSFYEEARDPYGNYIFEKINNYVACAWKGDDIVVGDVTISPPYCLEDVKGPKDNVDRICSWVKFAKRSDANL